MLAGRDDELSVVGSMLGRDSGGSLLFVGAAGVGKSALLESAARTAARDGRTVLHATGVQGETRVPFAGLHQLLYPLASRFAALAAPQHHALLAAFGRLHDPAVDVFLIALATLELLARAAAGRRLLIVQDDLQWTDDETARVLAFVARRVASEPVVLLAATRPGVEDPLSAAGVPARMLRPLGDGDATRLLRLRHPDLDDQRRDWVLGHARGNPLALTELPLAAGAAGPGAESLVPLTARLERSFAARLCGLSPTARDAVVVAAASDGADLAEVAAAVALAVPGSSPGALGPAMDAGILVVREAAVTFEHPLLRPAVYQSARADLRRRAHAALAEVLTGQPERRARHLAAAALMPDEAVAAEIERTAESAGPSTGPASATAWERAANLTPQPDQRARRLLRAAGLWLELGHLGHAAELAAAAGRLPLSRAGRARLALITEALDPGVPGDPLRVSALAETAAELADAGQPDLAYQSLLAGAVRAWAADPGPQARAALAAAAARLPVPAHDPRLLAVGGFTDPARYGDLIARHVAALSPGRLDPVSAELATSAHLTGAGEPVAAVQRAVTDRARREGRRAALPRLLTGQAWNAVARADWPAAGPAADEAVRLARELRQPLWQALALAAQAMTAGLQGDQQAAADLAQRAEALVRPAPVSPVLCAVQFARGVTAIGAGDYDEAFSQLSRVFDPADPAGQSAQGGWALGDYAEAAVRTGRTGEARKVLDAGRPGPRDSVAPWTRVALDYADALLAEDHLAEAAFGRALSGDGLARWPAYRARLLLEYGSWLRRQRRSTEARPSLRSARQLCEAHGLAPWAERVRGELRAAGEAVAAPGGDPRTSLSPQELRIAELAGEGLSNREIGQRLRLSHRTVGSHLYRMFPKLGITSRVQLRGLLEPGPAAERRRELPGAPRGYTARR